MDDARAWQTRPLEDVYPVAVPRRAGAQDPRRRHRCSAGRVIWRWRSGWTVSATCSGMWFQANEGAKFWMQVLTDLKQRGVQDILICCVDGLKGFPEAIEAVFPQTTVQTCIVHLIRQSLKYVPAPAIRRGRQGPQADLHRDRRRRTRCRARGVRGEMGRAAAGDRPGVARQLGVRDPVPGVRTRGPPRDLHHERDRGAQPAATQRRSRPRAASRPRTPPAS